MSATSRHSPAIPLSPSSPPDTGVKERSKTHLIEIEPQSPASPPLMSVATKSYASPFTDTQTSSDAATSQQSFSPPTSTNMSTQDHQHSIITDPTAFTTPPSSIGGVSQIQTSEDRDQHRSKRQKIDSEEARKGDNIDTEESPYPSNHDRQLLSDASQPAQSGETTDSSNDRSTAEGGLKKSKLASDEMSLESLQKDMGDAFLLCKSTFQRSRPSPSQHLLALYGLSPLHATVARTDPATGEKINKLRKSYEGKIKDFALAGRNKPVKVDVPDGGKGKLRSLMEDITEEQWQAENATKKIEITPDFRSTLLKAMEMRPGTTRNHEMWEDVLGHEKARPVTVPEVPVKKTLPVAAPVAAPVQQPNGAVRRIGPNGPNPADVVRPRRANKKRSYADNSFEGYGDGFVDDDGDLDAGAYSNSEDGGGGPGRKKRKKEHSFNASPTSYDRLGYGVGAYVDGR